MTQRARISGGAAARGAAVLAIAGALSVIPVTLGASARAARTPEPRAIDPPIATSLTTTAGTWASVPMGHLRDRLTTFWQLFFLPTTGGAWTDRTARLGMATNGGILFASPAGAPFLVGIRPSNLLHYSAFATTQNGRTWTAASPVQGDVASLSAGTAGRVFALLDDRSGGRVLSAQSAAAAWHTLVTAREIADSSAGRACAPLSLSALASGPSGEPVVGADCRRTGASGVFSDRRGDWSSIGPHLDARGARVEVLSLQTRGGELSALFAILSRSGTRLVEGWGHPGSWQLSSSLRIGAHTQLVSVGPSPDSGEFVLSRAPSGAERLVLVTPRRTWSALRAPPKGTETVAFPSATRVDALSVSGNVMSDYVLTVSASAWSREGVVHVRILYGSSGV